MQLKDLEIVNFRGIARLRLRVEADATVLFGENAWGKTSLVEARHITPLPDLDLEHFLWREGYEAVFRRAAGPVGPEADASAVIHQALRACSKPGMALEVAEEAGRLGPAHIPALLGQLFSILRDKAKPAGDGPGC
jgi:predicted ATP-dependent endonuclease of OLD family